MSSNNLIVWPQSIPKQSSDLFPAHYGCISLTTLCSIAIRVSPQQDLRITKKGTTFLDAKGIWHGAGELCGNIQRFLYSISNQISCPKPRANLKSIRIKSLIFSDPPIRVAQVMSANQIINALLCPTQISRTYCQRLQSTFLICLFFKSKRKIKLRFCR